MKLKHITPQDLYTSVLTARRVTNEEGWTRMEPVGKRFEPTGSRVMDIIGYALMQDPTADSSRLAAILETDAATLNAVMRLLTGMPARDFIREYRMLRACEYLACTGLDVQTVARRCGSSSHGNFTRLFTERMKQTPQEYRRTHRPADFRERYGWEP